MDWQEIPRTPAATFRPPRFGGEPRVVLDNVCDWPALRAWTADYLQTAAGAATVAVRETVGPPNNIYQNLAAGGRISFGQYLDWVIQTAHGSDFRAILHASDNVSDIIRAVGESGFERSYYLDARLETMSHQLFEDVRIPRWYAAPPVDIFFWCGILGTSSGLHFDVTPNCNVQVTGHKHFILFAPGERRRLYQVRGGAHCRFDPNLPDYTRFPLARQVQGWHCTLNPGESLYIPPGWFHQVTVTSAWAVNVNFFWPRPFPQGLVSPVLWRLLLRRGWSRMRAAIHGSGTLRPQRAKLQVGTNRSVLE